MSRYFAVFDCIYDLDCKNDLNFLFFGLIYPIEKQAWTFWLNDFLYATLVNY